MSNFAWFRLLVRAVGLLLIGLGAPALLRSLGYLFTAALFRGPGGSTPTIPEFLWMYVGDMAGSLLQAGIGAYLLLGGKALVRRCIAEVDGTCMTCGYDLRAITAAKCPECGSPNRRPRAEGEQPAATEVH